MTGKELAEAIHSDGIPSRPNHLEETSKSAPPFDLRSGKKGNKWAKYEQAAKMADYGIPIQEIAGALGWKYETARNAIWRGRNINQYIFQAREGNQRRNKKYAEQRRLLKDGAEWHRLKFKYGDGKKQPQDPKTGRWTLRPRKLPKASKTPPLTTQAIRDEFNRRLCEGDIIKGDGSDKFSDAMLKLDMSYEHFARLTMEAKRTVEYWRRDNTATPSAWTILWLMEKIPEIRILLESRYEVE